MFDYGATYYKIIGRNHGNHKYVIGLNRLDHEAFDSRPVCGPGGLYFSDVQHIFDFVNYGDHLCVVTIPCDTKVVQVDHKFKAEQLHISRIITAPKDEIIKYLVKNGAIVTSNTIRWADNRLEIVQFLDKHGIETRALFVNAIKIAGETGDNQVLEYILSRGADITMMDHYALRLAAFYGHVSTVRFLVEHGSDAFARRNCALQTARRNGHKDVVEYIKKLKGE